MSSKVMTKGELFEVLKDIPDDWEIYISARKDEAGWDGLINLRNIHIERKETVGRNDVILVARNWDKYHDDITGVEDLYDKKVHKHEKPIRK